MSKYDDLELIINSTERQLDAYRAELAKLKEEAEAKFITGEFVQARDHLSENWTLGVYIEQLVNRDYPHRVTVAGLGGISFKLCRLPKDVPGILIRHDGSGRCPVDGENISITVFPFHGRPSIERASYVNWPLIRYYVILPEHVK